METAALEGRHHWFRLGATSCSYCRSKHSRTGPPGFGKQIKTIFRLLLVVVLGGPQTGASERDML